MSLSQFKTFICLINKLLDHFRRRPKKISLYAMIIRLPATTENCCFLHLLRFIRANSNRNCFLSKMKILRAKICHLFYISPVHTSVRLKDFQQRFSPARLPKTSLLKNLHDKQFLFSKIILICI